MGTVIAAAAIVIAGAAFVLAAYQRRQLLRPFLIFQELKTEGKVIGFYIANIGQGAAVNLDIPPDQVEKDYLGEEGRPTVKMFSEFKDITRDLSVGGRTLISRHHKRYLNSKFKAEVSYFDVEGTPYRTLLQSMKHEFEKPRLYILYVLMPALSARWIKLGFGIESSKR